MHRLKTLCLATSLSLASLPWFLAGEEGEVSSPVPLREDETDFWVTIDGPEGFAPLAVAREEVSRQSWVQLMEGKQEDSPISISAIAWAEATSFAEQLTERHQKLGLLEEGESYRLPTSSEWMALSRDPEIADALKDMDGGLREFCLDNRSERFPSREKPDTWQEVIFAAVIGPHDRLGTDVDLEAFYQPSWVREDTKSSLIGFRLVRVRE